MNINHYLAQTYQAACLAEIEALKPGNVHLFADGHGMVVQDFIKSASVSSAVIARPELTLGARINCAVDATWQAVGCNTNLGIVLLCAPIIHAAINLQMKDIKKDALHKKLLQILANSTIDDAQSAFNAITLAQPAGLGSGYSHDVQNEAQCTLLEAMKTAADRDVIALQYSNGFNDVFYVGLLQYQVALALWQNPAWAVTALHLFWMANYLDSHVVRKYGFKVANDLQAIALQHKTAFLKQTNPKQYQSKLMQFDQNLKQKGINPGTSADLTVATLFVSALLQN